MSLPQLPASVPPLPKGYVYLGRGGTLKTRKLFFGLALGPYSSHWRKGRWNGICEPYQFAAPANSEIVEDAKPKAKRVKHHELAKIAANKYAYKHDYPFSTDYYMGWLAGYRSRAAMRRAKK